MKLEVVLVVFTCQDGLATGYYSCQLALCFLNLIRSFKLAIMCEAVNHSVVPNCSFTGKVVVKDAVSEVRCLLVGSIVFPII